jgi:hypothetical protein
MKIVVCAKCKKQQVEGILCRHCDTSYCYDCLDIMPHEMRTCPECEKFICDECYAGMVECDIKGRG